MRKLLPTIGLIAAVAAGTIGCGGRGDNKEDVDPRKSQKPKGRMEEILDSSDIEARERSRDEKFYVNFDMKKMYGRVWGFQDGYMLQDGSYILRMGAMSYLVGRDGQVLSSGSHGLIKDGDKILSKTGANVREAVVPTSLEDFGDGDIMHDIFVERDGNVYVKGLSGP